VLFVFFSGQRERVVKKIDLGSSYESITFDMVYAVLDFRELTSQLMPCTC